MKLSEEMQSRLDGIVSPVVLNLLIEDAVKLEEENQLLKNKVAALQDPEQDDMYWFDQAESYYAKIVKLRKSNDSLIKSINALMAKMGHA